jgi:Zn-dependent protease
VIELPKLGPPTSFDPIRNCPQCGNPLSLGALACPQCHALVHSEELLRLSTSAKKAEEQNDPGQAREIWLRALALLPRDSTQAQWIRDHVGTLQLASAAAPQTEKHPWASKLGPLAPIAIFLAKSKTLLFAIFKLKFLFSLGAFVALYWALYGLKFGAGFAFLILLHEMGHYLDIRRRGLPADMPVFLPGLGAYVRWEAIGVSRETRAAVSLAGPLAGFVGAAVCAGLFHQSHYGLRAALGRSSAVLNVLNLTPVWILDGGQAATALIKSERIVLLAACLLLWLVAGQGIFFLVAAGLTYRLFTKDFPPLPSRRTLLYYLGLIGGYGLLLHFLPA